MSSETLDDVIKAFPHLLQHIQEMERNQSSSADLCDSCHTCDCEGSVDGILCESCGNCSCTDEVDIEKER
jgi:hypothetical protein